MTRGLDQPLYVLPFDHRGSFQTDMFGWQSPLSPEQTAEIAAAQRVAGGPDHARGRGRRDRATLPRVRRDLRERRCVIADGSSVQWSPRLIEAWKRPAADPPAC
jgi:hypothetical protein